MGKYRVPADAREVIVEREDITNSQTIHDDKGAASRTNTPELYTFLIWLLAFLSFFEATATATVKIGSPISAAPTTALAFFLFDGPNPREPSSLV